MAPLWGGEYTLERLAGGIIPRFPLWCRDPPDGPPQRSFVGQFPRALGSIPGHLATDFYRFFGLSWEDTASMLLFDMHADFFFRFDLRRNHFIKRVELFEESSILLLRRCLEASG